MARNFCSVLEHPLVRYGVGALALLVFGIMSLVFLPPIRNLAGSPPDLWVWGFSPERFSGFLGALGAQGVALYRLFLYADLGFAPLYGFALAGWVCYFYRSPAYAAAPLLAAFLDEVENFLFLINLEAVRPVLVVLAGYVSFFKWVFLVYTAFALVLGFWYRRR